MAQERRGRSNRLILEDPAVLRRFLSKGEDLPAHYRTEHDRTRGFIADVRPIATPEELAVLEQVAIHYISLSTAVQDLRRELRKRLPSEPSRYGGL